MDDKPKPKTLYKFRSWKNDPNSPKENLQRTLLTKRQLWVPTATDLNDPFDCCIPYRYDLMKRNELVKRFVKLAPKELSRQQRKKFALDRIRESGMWDRSRRQSTMMQWTQAFREAYGVLSFATVKDVPLLWSHYSDSYRGYCIGIDHVLFGEVLKDFFYRVGIPMQEVWVKYVRAFPTIVPLSDTDKDLENFLELFTTKSEHWDYEREYRYVFMRPPESGLILSPQCVSEVILGSEMPEAHKEEVTKAVREQFPSAQLLLARRKTDSFELEFVPV